jgi:acetylornithine deacetylase/succinyl-diaminopimelate desuccinylase-like protein
VRNKGGHSSLPVKDNAIYHLAGALDRLSQFEFPMKINDVTREYFRAMSTIEKGPVTQDLAAVAERRRRCDGARCGRIDVVECNASHDMCRNAARGGHASNALPQLAAATVNCRVLPEDSLGYVTSALTRVINDTAVKLTVTGTPLAGPASPMREDLTHAVKTLTTSMWPGVPRCR